MQKAANGLVAKSMSARKTRYSNTSIRRATQITTDSKQSPNWCQANSASAHDRAEAQFALAPS